MQIDLSLNEIGTIRSALSTRINNLRAGVAELLDEMKQNKSMMGQLELEEARLKHEETMSSIRETLHHFKKIEMTLPMEEHKCDFSIDEYRKYTQTPYSCFIEHNKEHLANLFAMCERWDENHKEKTFYAPGACIPYEFEPDKTYGDDSK